MRTTKELYKNTEDNTKKWGLFKRKGSSNPKEKKDSAISRNTKTPNNCPCCNSSQITYAPKENYIECDSCGFVIDRSFEGVSPLPEWNLVRTKDNFDEWIEDWDADVLPHTISAMEFVQMTDARENPDLEYIIMDPQFKALMDDVWEFLKWNNRFSENSVFEFGKGLFEDFAHKVLSPTGRKEVIDSIFGGEYDRDIRQEAFILRDFSKLQDRFGRKG